MKTILVINDNSCESKHAAEFALAIAQRVGANLMLANNYIKSAQSKELIASGNAEMAMPEVVSSELVEHLKELNSSSYSYKPEIEELDISNMDENGLAEAVIQNQTWMMVKGMADYVMPGRSGERRLDIHAVLNKVLCPLFLVPAGWEIKDIERVVYVADLRYCRIQVVRYLAELSRPWSADVSIAHLSAKGLPDMAESYALNVFTDEVCKNVNYDRLLFNNIREKNLGKAVDVLINGMHNDVLVMVNHRYHFEQILGRYITDSLPSHLTVPLLIFPY